MYQMHTISFKNMENKRSDFTYPNESVNKHNMHRVPLKFYYYYFIRWIVSCPFVSLTSVNPI